MTKEDELYIDIAQVKQKRKPVFDVIEPTGDVVGEEISLKQVLSLKIFNMIQELEHKIINGRIKDKEAEKIRLEYIKTYVNACNCFNNISKDIDNDYDKVALTKFLKENNLKLE